MDKKFMTYSEKNGPNRYTDGSTESELYKNNEKVWEAAIRTNLKLLLDGKSDNEKKLESQLEQALKKNEALQKALDNIKEQYNKLKQSKV
jgi:hypothetical protein